MFALTGLVANAQGPAQKVYDTERAFEKIIAEKGMNAGFIEFMAADGVMFFPEPANARETYAKRPPIIAALTWNPVLVCASSNGAMAYSVGNSIYRPKGKEDPSGYAGHYLTVWLRQPNGEYRAVLDGGINHDKPASLTTEWKAMNLAAEVNGRHLAAADSSVPFFQIAESAGLEKAYKAYLADDAIILRDANQPFFGKRAALDHLKKGDSIMKVAKRRSFVEAGELGYFYGPYSRITKAGVETEKGNLIQVWRMRGGKWQIVADLSVVIPKSKG